MRKNWKTAVLVAVAALVAGAGVRVALDARTPMPADGPVVTVYKSATCGCCKNWVAHLRENGFEVEAVDTEQLDRIKAEHGVPGQLRSCHTAVVDGYVIKGHVPADLVRRFLAERPPEAAGLAVPGMPIGSPGMEVPGRPAESYDVIAFTEDGRAAVYAER